MFFMTVTFAATTKISKVAIAAIAITAWTAMPKLQQIGLVYLLW